MSLSASSMSSLTFVFCRYTSTQPRATQKAGSQNPCVYTSKCMSAVTNIQIAGLVMEARSWKMFRRIQKFGKSTWIARFRSQTQGHLACCNRQLEEAMQVHQKAKAKSRIIGQGYLVLRECWNILCCGSLIVAFRQICCQAC